MKSSFPRLECLDRNTLNHDFERYNIPQIHLKLRGWFLRNEGPKYGKIKILCLFISSQLSLLKLNIDNRRCGWSVQDI